MARWPNPTYNHIIEKDPQIAKVPLDEFQWGARRSILPTGQNPQGNKSGNAPTAPEMSIRHVKGS